MKVHRPDPVALAAKRARNAPGEGNERRRCQEDDAIVATPEQEAGQDRQIERCIVDHTTQVRASTEMRRSDSPYASAVSDLVRGRLDLPRVVTRVDVGYQ